MKGIRVLSPVQRKRRAITVAHRNQRRTRIATLFLDFGFCKKTRNMPLQAQPRLKPKFKKSARTLASGHIANGNSLRRNRAAKGVASGPGASAMMLATDSFI